MSTFYINLISYFVGPESDSEILEKANSIKNLIKNENHHIVLSAVGDGHSVEYINYLLALLEVSDNDNRIKLIVDTLSLTGSFATFAAINFKNIIEYDSVLIRAAYYEDISGCNTEFNADATKFLYLPGKPYKIHRIRPLLYLYQQGLLNDNCEWSLCLPESIKPIVYQYVPELNQDEYGVFASAVTKSLDNINVALGSDSYHYNGFPIDFSLYSATKCSLISETYFNEPLRSRFITEKTWRTISNKHPFVLLGQKEMYDYLESLGIDTFQYAVKHKKDSLIGDDETIIKKCMENIIYMLHDYPDSEKLLASTRSNYETYKRLTTRNRVTVPEPIERCIQTFVIDYEFSEDEEREIWGR
jgi:hypothetical protein